MPLVHHLSRASSPLELRYIIRQARLQESPEVINTKQHAVCLLYSMPLFYHRDTPLRSLYRLYEDICADYRIVITYECEYLFRRGSKRWLLSQIPDPKEPDLVRYAILASLVEALVDAFNWKLELGLRRGNMHPDQSEDRATNFVREVSPAWTKDVAGLEKHVSLINRKTEPSAIPDKNFLQRNIEASTGYMFTA
ncbi:hypothetical protein CJF32_00008581 [Rutstroemia sp. NJR-2017a WRK4]|nr:hypothetical protein CJF32_00008581 [Rutstroemia sp. NJR-2017a WRK4]